MPGAQRISAVPENQDLSNQAQSLMQFIPANRTCNLGQVGWRELHKIRESGQALKEAASFEPV